MMRMRNPLINPQPGDVVRLAAGFIDRVVCTVTSKTVTFRLGSPDGPKVRHSRKRWADDLSETGVVMKVANRKSEVFKKYSPMKSLKGWVLVSADGTLARQCLLFTPAAFTPNVFRVFKTREAVRRLKLQGERVIRVEIKEVVE